MNVQCPEHGDCTAAVVCRHHVEIRDRALGFVENSSDPDDLQAWCGLCEASYEQERELNQAFRAFNDFRVVCVHCYAALKERHGEAAAPAPSIDFDPPAVEDAALVGSFPARAHAGGGFVWDAVLEYRVWCHPHDGAPDVVDGDDYFHAFASFAEAAAFAAATPGAEEPLALVRQDEYLDEAEPGCYQHVRTPRVTEWPVGFLRRPRRTPRTIPDFLSPDAPANRLDILRGFAGPGVGDG